MKNAAFVAFPISLLSSKLVLALVPQSKQNEAFVVGSLLCQVCVGGIPDQSYLEGGLSEKVDLNGASLRKGPGSFHFTTFLLIITSLWTFFKDGPYPASFSLFSSF